MTTDTMSPSREENRLQLLRSYGILDTEPEEEFDEITRAASLVCGTPIATITLVDESRQWFKSRVGLDSSETPREFSFCAHAMQQPETFIVPNAEKDPRFSHNPLVTGDPNIRFYCGMPLRSEGLGLGTLCVIDRTPRTLSHEQMQILKVLSGAVLSRLQLHRALHLIEDLQPSRRLNATHIVPRERLRMEV
jgi:GAF domain-containing protein